MDILLIVFWSVLIIASIFWYGGLVFAVGIKAGREVRELIKSLGAPPRSD